MYDTWQMLLTLGIGLVGGGLGMGAYIALEEIEEEEQMKTRHGFMLEAIAEREGDEMAQAHETEKTMVEVQNHFDAHYAVFESDVNDHELVSFVTEKLERYDLTLAELIDDYEVTDLMELYHLTGFITKIREFWVISLDYPWLEQQEQIA